MRDKLQQKTGQNQPAAAEQTLLWGQDNAVRRRMTRVLQAIAAGAAGDPGRTRSSSILDRAASRWLEQAAERPADAAYALEAMGWSLWLPALADRLAPATRDALIERLMRDAGEASQLAFDGHPLVHQLLAGELALRLAAVHPQPKTARQLVAAGRRAVAAGLAELLDGRGVPHARYLPIVWPLLACWTRVRRLSEELPGGAWGPSLQREWQRFVAAVLRLCRPEGESAFGFGQRDDGLLAAAIEFCGDEAKTVARLVLSPATNARRGRRAAMPKPSACSEWAALATIRSDWQADAVRAISAFPGRTNLVELAVGPTVLLSGLWDCEVAVNGIPAEPTCDWEPICWESDEDVDYLELEIDFSEGVRVQRHLVVAREDRFALLADAVVSPGAVQLDYRGRIPLAPGMRYRGQGANTEGLLLGAGPLARLVPLELPEWREAAGPGRLGQSQRQLELTHSMIGRGIFAAVWIDLDRRRLRAPLTWRHLTVGESLHPVPRDVAVGYRVAIGKQQWIVYRSLGRKGNRTLLGHNLSSETLVARFDRDGSVTPLIEIE